MPSLVNRVPPGLLSLLDIKSLGQNPTVLSDTITPNIDVLRAYVAAFSQPLAVSSAPVSAAGFFAAGAPLEPTPGQILILDGVCAVAQAAIGAGVTMTIKMGITQQTLGGVFSVFGNTVTATTGAQPAIGSNDLIILPAGYWVGIYADSVSGGAGPTFAIRARATRLVI